MGRFIIAQLIYGFSIKEGNNLKIFFLHKYQRVECVVCGWLEMKEVVGLIHDFHE
jgi:hypothetical protein